MHIFLIGLMTLLQASAAATIDARRVTISQPRAVLEWTGDAVQGLPVRLAWSADGEEIYLRGARSDRWGNERVWHYIYRVSTRRLTPVDGEPPWAGMYWARKAALVAPGDGRFRIEAETRQARRTATNAGSAGSMGQSGGDPYLGAELGPQGQSIVMSSMQAQQVTTTTLRLKGELLAEFVNTLPVPGLTHGWAPPAVGLIAYVNAKKRLVLMDAQGHKQVVSALKDVLLPAWSDDGSRLACIQRRGRDRYVLWLLDAKARQP